jgi:hypothetical protein
MVDTLNAMFGLGYESTSAQTMLTIEFCWIHKSTFMGEGAIPPRNRFLSRFIKNELSLAPLDNGVFLSCVCGLHITYLSSVVSQRDLVNLAKHFH